VKKVVVEKKIEFYYPQNLDLETIINEHNSQGGTRSKLKVEKALCVIDSIIRARMNQRKEMIALKSDYARVHSMILKQKMHDYMHYVVFLKNMGIIEVKNGYIVGEKSKLYRLASKYRGSNLDKKELSDWTLNKAIKNHLEEREESYRKELKSYRYLTKWWNTGKLSIDFTGAINWIEEYKSQKIEDLQSASSEAEDFETKYKQIVDTTEDFKALVHNIPGNKSIHLSGVAKRLYSPITNLKRELRNYLQYEGQSLVEIDIKSCQPYLSILLFDQNFWKSPRLGGGKFCFKEIRREEIREYIKKNDINMFLESLKSLDSTALQGIENYKMAILEGKFYEIVQSKLKDSYPELFTTRDATKLEVLKMLYFDTRKETIPFYRACQDFRKIFPGVYDLFKKIKAHNYKTLPLLLQSLESFLMLDKVCYEIYKQFPDAPIFTIHDSILTTQKYADNVESVLKSTLKRYVGAEPMVGRKIYSPGSSFTPKVDPIVPIVVPGTIVPIVVPDTMAA